MPKESIPVFLACTDNYVQHLCVVLASILQNSKADFSFHILHRDITAATQDKVKALQGIRPFDIEFIKVDAGIFSNLKITIEYISIETYYRLLIPSLKPDLAKAIYLDCDLVVRGDLQELWETPIDNHYVAGVEDFIDNGSEERRRILTSDRYFNAGVLLLNLHRIRQDFSLTDFLQTGGKYHGKLEFQDQDILNIAFGPNAYYLSPKWNVSYFFVYHFLGKQKPKRPGVLEAMQDPAIFHFIGPDKPWIVPRGINAQLYTKDYFYYLRLTPYAESEKSIHARYNSALPFLRYWLRHPFFFLRKKFHRRRHLLKSLKDPFAVSGK